MQYDLSVQDSFLELGDWQCLVHPHPAIHEMSDELKPITHTHEEPLQTLWRAYEQDELGDLPVETLREIHKAFISGFAAAHNLLNNYVPRLNDHDATVFLTTVQGELKHAIKEFRANKKGRKIIVT